MKNKYIVVAVILLACIVLALLFEYNLFYILIGLVIFSVLGWLYGFFETGGYPDEPKLYLCPCCNRMASEIELINGCPHCDSKNSLLQVKIAVQKSKAKEFNGMIWGLIVFGVVFLIVLINGE